MRTAKLFALFVLAAVLIAGCGGAIGEPDGVYYIPPPQQPGMVVAKIAKDGSETVMYIAPGEQLRLEAGEKMRMIQFVRPGQENAFLQQAVPQQPAPVVQPQPVYVPAPQPQQPVIIQQPAPPPVVIQQPQQPSPSRVERPHFQQPPQPREVTCHTCGGTGKILCPTCHGQCYLERCVRCNGTGEMWNPDHTINYGCIYCKGTGRRKCETCLYIDVPQGTIPCRRCNGTGKITQ